MGPDGPGLLLIDRAAERARLEANVATRRHSLLVGPIGCGKTHLLRVVAETLPDALYVDAVRPFRVTLLTLCQALHARQALRMEDGPPTSLPWPDCAKRLGRLNIRELTDIVVASLTDRAWVLVLDQLEGVTPSMGPSLERLLGTACVLGATRALKPGMEKLWWAFDRIELAPLTREETRELLWAVADRDKLADPAMFEAKVLSQANGNPYAVVELVKQVAGEGTVSRQAIRDLHHAAGIRYLDLTPALLLVGAGLVATRFVALGLDDVDLYILAGSLGAVFLVARYWLFRGPRRGS
jgi:energy-coupling factor transporter ATP-binding protein EcfA2